MKHYWKKALCLLLALCLMTSLFAACGGKDNSSGGESSNAENSSGGAAEDTNFNPTGMPIVNEPVTLTFLYVKGANLRDFNENSMFQEMEKTTNVHIDWQYAGDADWGEQKSLLLAGGDLPDVFFGNNSLGDVDVLTNLDLFIPLEDYIDKYCPTIKAAYEAEPIMRKMITQPDGHIYTLSSKLPLRPKACDVLYINQKWLDNLNLDTPTTVDEWYEVLKAFKEQDANGNGDPNDEIPFGGCGKGDMCGHWIKFITPWGLAESMEGNYLALDQKTGEPIFIPADERYKEAVQFFEKLYAEGIMDPEYFTQDGSQADAKLKNEEITLVGTNIAWEVAADTNPHSDEYVPLLPLAGPRGDRLTRANDGVIIYRRNEFTVTTACEHPEIAMRWADYYSTDEISIQSYWGPYGEALEKQDDGTITFLDPPEGKNGDVWYWEITCRDYGPKYVTPETEAKIQLPPDSGDGAKLAVDEVYKDYAAKPFPVVNYTPEQMDEISKLTADIYKYVNECWANWIVNGGIENDWDSYIAQLKQMGLERLMEIYQEAADAYNEE